MCLFLLSTLYPCTDVTIYKGTRVAKASPVESMMVTPVGEVPSSSSNVPHVSPQKHIMLQKMVERSACDLTTNEEELYKLLLEYADIFAESSAELGGITKSNTLLTQVMNTLFGNHVDECHQQGGSRLEALSRTCSRKTSFNPHLVVGFTCSSGWEKRRLLEILCIDYRKLNAITRKDAYPLPRVDDSLEALNGSRWFSTLDLLSGYWQVEIDEKDPPKTAFTTGDGLFEFRVMLLGLCNAPAVFQRLMDLVLSGIRWEHCLVY